MQVLEQRIAQLERRLSNGEDYVSNNSNSTHPLSSSSSHMNKKAADGNMKCVYMIGILMIDDDFLVPSISKASQNPLFGDDKDLYPPMDILIHLVDLFFKHLNSVFPLVHRKTLKRSIHDGTVSRPLLWAIMAIGAR